ncbi:MAG: polyphosphate kinase 1 [Phycisphaerae bacterium]|nr:polyphosphate kinase 1 [Phycisphaerae bacterium]
MAKKHDKSKKTDLFINRELSWLAFNERVLEQGLRAALPPLERLKFLAIFSTNLDEFFMIRVAGLMQQAAAGVRKQDPAGLTLAKQLKAIARTAQPLVQRHTQAVNALLDELRPHGLHVLRRHEWTKEQRDHLCDFFEQEMLPVLTPLAVQELNPCPLLPGLQMHLAVTVGGAEAARLLVVPIPAMFIRYMTVPAPEGTVLAAVEDIVADNAALLCPNATILSVDFFRLTRDADVSIQEDEAGDLLETVEDAVLARRRRAVVRIEVNAGASQTLLDWLSATYGLDRQEFYTIDGRLNGGSFWEIVGRSGYERLRLPDWPPQWPQDLQGYDSLWEAISDRDILLVHPYESFEPVVKLLKEAAEDPDVLAIKQTLYRTSGDSPIIDALEQAAENGKEVTVLLELKARFDEARNVVWARRLEDAGCHVIYGVTGLKTHAKALLIVRRESGFIRRYVHLATGNYNDKTARLYSDIGLMSCDSRLASDVATFFNLLTGFSESTAMEKLFIAPLNIRRKLAELIDREIAASSPDRPGLIIAKTNSLEDKDICLALYRASQAGVRVRLNVRGICCLRPGIKGVSDTIEVVSILDRYLEHARIYYFSNAGHPEIYLSSADLMGRNLDKRFETLIPVLETRHRKRLSDILELYFRDTAQSWKLGPNGIYTPSKPGKKPLSAQTELYRLATESQKKSRIVSARFKPIKSEKK